ncbi:twin-arginine translocase TatA/TatE family subunit [Caldinitratiruptor microaerophilus]|uniref:Sec-independent protein translocase protein TatA n=1 Tax=Caldinitratiruptor microaerophilus TaxID=671077 RepID=A0AA35G7F0_9FIRM|nr:twin-arginine translocase TatA/TatE family subunit [Caldinitratiruptor microaerophilus]BDG59253.1 hypothetical protein caldi_03430 [Caldinitratiruptor microaerophilus]
MFRNLGPMEIGLILLILLLLFGGSKLPELARGLGKGIREFKQSMRDEGPAEEKPPAGGAPEKTAAEGSARKEG